MHPSPARFLRALLLAALSLGAAASGIPASGRMVFRAYGPAEGLEHTSLTALAQDAAGFLWVGTEGGAYRFDGTGFRLWGLPEGLPSAWVRAFGPARDGTLWIGTRAGLCALRDGAIRHLEPGDPLATARIHQILQDAKGQIWVAAETGLFRSVGRGLRFAPVQGWPGGPAFALALDPDGLWVGGIATLRFRDDDGEWHTYGAADGVPREAVKALLRDRRDTLWVRTPGALRILRPGSSRLAPAGAGLLPPLAVSFYEESLAEDGQDGVLVPTAKGLLRFDASGGWKLLDEGRGLPAGWANRALVDRAGNLWVGSLGLHRLQGGGAWENFTRLDGLPADNTWGLVRDRAGVLWIGTSGGLARLDARGPAPFAPGAGLVLYALKEAPDGAIWGAGEHPFLVRISPDRTRVTRVPLPASAAQAVPVSLAFDREGALWVGTSNDGLWRVADPSGAPSFLQAPLPGTGDLGQITALHLDARNRLWVATGRGLACLEQGRWRLFGKEIGLRPAPLWAMAPLPDGTAWIGYLEPMGLSRVDLRGDTPRVMEQRTRRDGLASDSVYSLAADPAGRLWIGGPRGVQCMDGQTLRLYRREDGLAGTDCNPFATWVDPEGGVWFGSTAGLLHHREAKRAAGGRLPEALLVSMALGSRRWERPMTGEGNLGVVPYEERTLSAQFSTLAFEHEGRLRFQARLTGLEDDWIDLPTRELRYPGLPPGTYRLEVRAVLEGAGPGAVTSVSFQVMPPWWRRWWASLLWVGLAFGAGLGALRWRVRWLRRRNEELKTLVHQRTEALELSNLALTTISTTDHLTGLRNRRYLAEELPSVMALALRAQRDHAGTEPPTDGCLVFAMLDLDHFKRVNDTWSHAAGDMALRQLADVLKREARESDFIIRWGGEEILFVGHTLDLAGAAAAVSRLHQAVRNHPFDLGLSHPVDLTCSIGFSLFPFQPDHLEASSWEDQVRVADRCLYAAKRSGRDAWIGVAGRSGSSAGLAQRFDQAPGLSVEGGLVDLVSGLLRTDPSWD
jgi:diguanylate cyclase (GGDEF)-like protein